MSEVVEAPAAPAAAPEPVAPPAADPKAAAPASSTPAASAAPTAPAAKGTPPAKTAATPTPAAEPVKGAWPEDWAARFAKGDEKLAKMFSRYASPEAAAEAHASLRKRMDSGEFKTALPKDPKPEELAAWRKDNGIPASPDKYDLKFDSGLVIGKEDKMIVDEFLKSAHAGNFTPDQAKGAIEWYMKDREAQSEAIAAKDETDRVKALDTLNAEYGTHFRRNVNLMDGVLTKFPEAIREGLKSARLPDGTALFNHPDVVRTFVAIALENNPAGIVAPAGIGDAPMAALEEYKSIQKLMREDRGAYNKDNAKQARMKELVSYLHTQGVIDQNGNEVVQQKRKAA